MVLIRAHRSISDHKCHPQNPPKCHPCPDTEPSPKSKDITPPALLARPCEPRNHAVFFRQCVSVPSLCRRFGHDRLVPVLRGLAERLLRYVAWTEGSLGRGHFDIDGCSPRVRGQDGCPRPRDMSPAGVVCTRPCGTSLPGKRGCMTYQAMVQGGLSGDRLEGAVEDSGPAAPALTYAQAGAHGLHTALRPLHARLRRPRQRRGRRSSVPLRG